MEIMEARNFAAKVQELIGDGYEVEALMVTRNNVATAGITIKNIDPTTDFSEICPVFYPDKNTSPEEIACSFPKMKEKMKEDVVPILDCLRNPEKRNAALWLSLTSDPGYANKFVHKKIEDIYIILSILYEDKDGYSAKCNFSTRLMRHEMMNGVMEEDLFETALKNVEQQASIMDIHTALQKVISSGTSVNLLNDETKKLDESLFMVVITTESQSYGAAAILVPSVQEWLLNHLGGKCFILPSSIHEVIAVPYDESMDPEELRTMVTDINREQVSDIDQLSDNAYILSKEGFKVA